MIMKSRVELLKAMYVGILVDATHTYPHLARSLGRDSSRLLSILDRNEIWFFTIFLPSFGKHFDRCLSNAEFLRMEGPHMRVAPGCKEFPRLFKGLFELVFDQDCCLRVDADERAILFLRTLLYAAKKIRMECEDAATFEAISSFVEVDEQVVPPTLNWDRGILPSSHFVGLTRDGVSASELEEGFLFTEFDSCDPELVPVFRYVQSVSDLVVAGFGSIHDGEIRPRHGPGAIADRRTCASKYQFSNWPAKLDRVFPYTEFGVPNLSYVYDPVDSGDDMNRFCDIDIPSKLVAVPKTQKGPRLIAAEPSAHMWMQQAVRAFLELSIKRSPIHDSIDFRDQSKSGQMALESSLTESHATIDLSDASDRMSCWLVERLFRSNTDLLEAFMAVRTSVIAMNADGVLDRKQPSLIKLRKFSTQGSALTFPVQSIVYTLISIASIMYARNERINVETIKRISKEVRVFGDDIIVPTDESGIVIKCIEALGFKTNPNKTFTKGNFRESCGVDAFRGHSVTPAYVLEPYDKAKPTTVASLVECSNNFYKKGFWQTAAAIAATLPTEILKRVPVVGIGSGSFGLVTFGAVPPPVRRKWNEQFHRYDAHVLTTQTKVRKAKHRGDFALLQYFTEDPDPMSKWENGEARRPNTSICIRWVAEETLQRGLVQASYI